MSRVHGWPAAIAAVLTIALGAAGAQAATAAPDLAVGRSADGRVTFRLEGDRLTASLRGRLGPRGSGVRPSVTVICGAGLFGGRVAEPADLASIDFAVRARRDLRVHVGVRMIRARLSADVARWADVCGIRWRSSAGSGTVIAPMRLRRGTPPGCAAPPGARVGAETDAVLVLRPGGETDYGDSWGRYVACRKPAGAWLEVDSYGSDHYNVGRFVYVVAAGTWVGWTRERTSWGDQTPSCSVHRLDLGAAAAPQEFTVAPPGGPPNSCARSLVLATNGAAAWLAQDLDETRPVEQRPASVNGLTAGGSVVALGSGLERTLTDLTISADGRTVTWRDGGLLRSAPL